MNEDRFAGRKGGADAIGAGRAFVPYAANREMDVGRVPQCGLVAERFQEHAVAVGQHDHGAGALDHFGHRRKAGTGAGDQVRVFADKIADLLAVFMDGRSRSVRVDSAFEAPPPGILDDRANDRA
jgi:hypothetical protein